MQNELLTLVRPEIITMDAYRSARSENTKGSTWLDANENPWGDTLYNRYPEPQPRSLVDTLSVLYGVRAEQVLVTRGSDEGIDLLVRLFCRAGQDQIMVCPPTYGMYKVAATIQGAGTVEVPLCQEENFSLNMSALLKRWRPCIKLIFLCSPNNPTGNLQDFTNILSLCKKLANQAIIIVDEAYIEFAMSEGLVKQVENFPNLIVLRTLSKAYGLAGIRCGATIANGDIIKLLKKIIAPYPVPRPIATIALQTLNRGFKGHVETINQEKNKLFNFLCGLPWVKKIWKSDTNFLLFEVLDAKKILAACLDHGIVLRDRSHEYGLTNCIRATIGGPHENTLLMEVLRHV